MDSLHAHRAYLEAEWRALQASPLSRRKALLMAALIDTYLDRMFAADEAAEDILVYREHFTAVSPALALVAALCAGRASLTIEAVAVPLADYGALPVEDFMVSLYNDHSVQRLRLALPDGARHDMQSILTEAMAAL